MPDVPQGFIQVIQRNHKRRVLVAVRHITMIIGQPDYSVIGIYGDETLLTDNLYDDLMHLIKGSQDA
jgi:hypothetical protein